MITIRIKPARQWFGGRKQWKFEIVGGNGERIDPRDTYANPGDIADIMRKLFSPDGGSVWLETHDLEGMIHGEQIR